MLSQLSKSWKASKPHSFDVTAQLVPHQMRQFLILRFRSVFSFAVRYLLADKCCLRFAAWFGQAAPDELQEKIARLIAVEAVTVYTDDFENDFKTIKSEYFARGSPRPVKPLIFDYSTFCSFGSRFE